MLNRSSVLVIAVAVFLLSCVHFAMANEVIDLWPGDGPPGFRHDRPETLDDPTRDDQRRDRTISYVSLPTLAIHRAAEGRATGAAVLVLPGGGYRNVVIDKEGHDIARWLNTIGVTAAVLKYRTRDPRKAMSGAVSAAVLADAKRAMRYVRSHAGELGIDPARIGAMGFSAGGDLAIRLAAASDMGDPQSQDPVARTACDPDFVVLVYPGVPIGTRFDFGDNPPPFFVIHAADDPKAPLLLSVRLTQELAAAGVPFELHAFQTGDHGFALGLAGGGVRWWPTLFEEWMRDQGLLDRKAARLVENRPAARIQWPALTFWSTGGGAAFAAGVVATLCAWLLVKRILIIARRTKTT